MCGVEAPCRNRFYEEREVWSLSKCGPQKTSMTMEFYPQQSLETTKRDTDFKQVRSPGQQSWGISKITNGYSPKLVTYWINVSV